MLRPDVVVPEGESLAQRELEDFLRARRERNLAGRDLIALPDDAGNLRPHLLDRDVEALEHARRKTFLFAEKPEENVLRPDVVVLERASLILRQDDNLSCSLGKPLEHGCLSFLSPLGFEAPVLADPPPRPPDSMVPNPSQLPMTPSSRVIGETERPSLPRPP